VCVPQRIRQTLLPSQRPLRPAPRAARPSPGRLPPGDDPALPARLDHQPDRRPARLRPLDRAPLDPPLPHPRHRWAGGPARSGRPRLGSPTLTKRILRLLGQPKAWTIGRLWRAAGRPAISLRTLHRRVRQVASWRRPRLVQQFTAGPGLLSVHGQRTDADRRRERPGARKPPLRQPGLRGNTRPGPAVVLPRLHHDVPPTGQPQPEHRRDLPQLEQHADRLVPQLVHTPGRQPVRQIIQRHGEDCA
jgi:hypothetical protein